MKDKNHWSSRNRAFKFNKFNTIFESIMSDIPAPAGGKSDPTLFLRKPSLNLIMEEIEKPYYVVSRLTGDTILLEDCIFWDRRSLIAEDILESVTDKVKELYQWIKEGISSILSESSDAILAFVERVKSSAIVQAIINKFNLGTKLAKEKFKEFFKVEDPDGKNVDLKQINESRILRKANLILEGGTLLKAEEEMSDPDQIKERIRQYEAGEITKKDGSALSESTVRARITLLQSKLNEFLNRTAEEATKPEEVESAAETINSAAKSETSDNADTTGLDSSTGADADKPGLFRRGWNATKRGVVGATNFVGGTIKKGAEAAGRAVKNLYEKSTWWVKSLIWIVIVLLAIGGLVWVAVSVIMPLFTVMTSGGAVAAGGLVFQIVMAGKTYYTAFKAGQKAWQSGEGWGKFFLMLGMSLLASFAMNPWVKAGTAAMKQ